MRDFWLFLRANGVDARLDLPAAERRQDWAQWMTRQIRDAGRILVVASPVIGHRKLQDITVPVLNAFYRRLLESGRRKADHVPQDRH